MFHRVRVVNIFSWCLLCILIPLSANAAADESSSCMGDIAELLFRPVFVLLYVIFGLLRIFIIPGIILLIIYLFLIR